MSKSGIKEIAQILAEKKKIDIAEAEKYIENFFSIVNEALITEKIVKVKGLGTFKLVDVRDRASVDVNTGERMVIDGHSKVSFVPDATLKELVNKPFSQFETVILNDGVSFDNIPSSVESTEKENVEQEETVEKSAESEEVKTEQHEEIHAKDYDEVEVKEIEPTQERAFSTLPSSPSIEETPSQIEGKEEITIEDKAENTAEEKEETVAEDVVITTDAEETSGWKQPENKENSTEEDKLQQGENSADTDNPIDLTVTNEHEEKQENQRSGIGKIALYSSIIMVALALMFFGGFYLGKNNIAEKVSTTETVAKKTAKKRVVRNTTKPVATPKEATEIKEDSLKQIQAKEVADAMNTKTTAEAADSVGHDKIDNARRLVKTGAYVIDGFDKSVKAKKGETIESISKYYLGDGMSCYIEVYNNKTSIKEGETINIPKLKLKKKSAEKKVSKN